MRHVKELVALLGHNSVERVTLRDRVGVVLDDEDICELGQVTAVYVTLSAPLGSRRTRSRTSSAIEAHTLVTKPRRSVRSSGATHGERLKSISQLMRLRSHRSQTTIKPPVVDLVADGDVCDEYNAVDLLPAQAVASAASAALDSADPPRGKGQKRKSNGTLIGVKTEDSNNSAPLSASWTRFGLLKTLYRASSQAPPTAACWCLSTLVSRVQHGHHAARACDR
eukprot:3059392-Amphidinium_carterae.2